MKTRGKRWLVFLLGSRTASATAGRLGALVHFFPWKQLPPSLLLLPGSRWDQQLWTPAHQADGKAKRLSWGFWLTTSNFLGWCQSTALSVLVGSAALTDWTKAQASKGQLFIYAQWAYDLITTRTNTALQGQTLLLDKHGVTQSACPLDIFEQVNKKHMLTQKRKPYPHLA